MEDRPEAEANGQPVGPGHQRGQLVSTLPTNPPAHSPRALPLKDAPPLSHLGLCLPPVSTAPNERPGPERIKILMPPSRESFAHEGRPCPASSLILHLSRHHHPRHLPFSWSLNGFFRVQQASQVIEESAIKYGGNLAFFFTLKCVRQMALYGLFCQSKEKNLGVQKNMGSTLILSLLGHVTLDKELSFSQETCFLRVVGSYL